MPDPKHTCLTRCGPQTGSSCSCNVGAGGGFLGRYVVNKLARVGTAVVVPHRIDDEDSQRHLKSSSLLPALSSSLPFCFFLPFLPSLPPRCSFFPPCSNVSSSVRSSLGRTHAVRRMRFLRRMRAAHSKAQRTISLPHKSIHSARPPALLPLQNCAGRGEERREQGTEGKESVCIGVHIPHSYMVCSADSTAREHNVRCLIALRANTVCVG